MAAALEQIALPRDQFGLPSRPSGRHLISVHECESNQLSQVDIEDHDLVDEVQVPHVDAEPEAQQQVELKALVPLVIASELEDEFLGTLSLSADDASEGGWFIWLTNVGRLEPFIDAVPCVHVDVRRHGD